LAGTGQVFVFIKHKITRTGTYQLTKVSKYAFECRMRLSPFKLEADDLKAPPLASGLSPPLFRSVSVRFFRSKDCTLVVSLIFHRILGSEGLSMDALSSWDLLSPRRGQHHLVQNFLILIVAFAWAAFLAFPAFPSFSCFSCSFFRITEAIKLSVRWSGPAIVH